MAVVGNDDPVIRDLDDAPGRVGVVGVLDQLRQRDVRLADEPLPELAQKGGIRLELGDLVLSRTQLFVELADGGLRLFGRRQAHFADLSLFTALMPRTRRGENEPAGRSPVPARRARHYR